MTRRFQKYEYWAHLTTHVISRVVRNGQIWFFLKCIMLYIIWKLTAHRVWKWTYWPHLTTRVTCRVVKNGLVGSKMVKLGQNDDIHHIIHHSKVEFTTYIYHIYLPHLNDICITNWPHMFLKFICLRNSSSVYPSHVFEMYMSTCHIFSKFICLPATTSDLMCKLACVFKLFRV